MTTARASLRSDNLFGSTAHTSSSICSPSHSSRSSLDLKRSGGGSLREPLHSVKRRGGSCGTHPAVTTSRRPRRERGLDRGSETGISGWAGVRSGFLSVGSETRAKLIRNRTNAADANHPRLTHATSDSEKHQLLDYTRQKNRVTRRCRDIISACTLSHRTSRLTWMRMRVNVYKPEARVRLDRALAI